MTTFTTADAPSLLELINQIDFERIQLPLEITIGRSTYMLTEKNYNSFKLGVLAAAEWRAVVDATLK